MWLSILWYSIYEWVGLHFPLWTRWNGNCFDVRIHHSGTTWHPPPLHEVPTPLSVMLEYSLSEIGSTTCKVQSHWGHQAGGAACGKSNLSLCQVQGRSQPSKVAAGDHHSLRVLYQPMVSMVSQSSTYFKATKFWLVCFKVIDNKNNFSSSIILLEYYVQG